MFHMQSLTPTVIHLHWGLVINRFLHSQVDGGILQWANYPNYPNVTNYTKLQAALL